MGTRLNRLLVSVLFHFVGFEDDIHRNILICDY